MDSKTRMKLSKWIPIGLLALSIIFIGLGIWNFIDYARSKEYYVSSEATIVSIYNDSHYDMDGTFVSEFRVYVDYEAEGEYFHDILYNGYDITMYVGKKVSIVYDRRTPNKLIVSKYPIAGLAGTGIGGIVLVATVVEMFISAKKKKNIDTLGNPENIDY